MTITGKVVREITGPELGPLHVGRNITTYAWDGKDTYGDRLANGVYLYRVVARLNGDYIKHRDSGADPWIESGFGKMMLIR
jgi:flagellar hook assembly protein FlgD